MGDITNRSRSSSASTLSEIFVYSSSSSSARFARSTSHSRMHVRDPRSHTPPLLSPSASSQQSVSEPNTPGLFAGRAGSPYFPQLLPVKRGRSSTVDALSAPPASGAIGGNTLRSTSSTLRADRPSKLRNVASCTGIFADLSFSVPSSPTYAQGRRASLPHALVGAIASQRAPLSPVSGSQSPQPLSPFIDISNGRQIEQIVVKYMPDHSSTAAKCKKLLLVLERNARTHTGSIASPPGTPGLAKVQKTAMAPRFYAKVGQDGRSAIEVGHQRLKSIVWN